MAVRTVQVVADAVEQPLAAAARRRRAVDRHRVDQTGGEALLNRARGARERDVPTVGGASPLVERQLDAEQHERDQERRFRRQGGPHPRPLCTALGGQYCRILSARCRPAGAGAGVSSAVAGAAARAVAAALPAPPTRVPHSPQNFAPG
jgi:hypothetical protein